jgi:hypothetical protein
MTGGAGRDRYGAAVLADGHQIVTSGELRPATVGIDPIQGKEGW